MLDSLRRHGIILFLGFLAMGFQGCGKAGRQQTNLSDSAVQDEQASGKQASGKQERIGLNFRGVPAKQSFERAKLRAARWNPKATLRLIQAHSWAVFGPSGSADPGSIEIKEWRFTFVGPTDQSRTYLVTPEQVREDDRGEGDLAGSLPPLTGWHIDVDRAVKVATAQGLEFASGPSLKMFSVRGKKVPIWVVPGQLPTPSLFVDARDGSIIPLEDAVYLGR
jgi:hypothetical protein